MKLPIPLIIDQYKYSVKVYPAADGLTHEVQTFYESLEIFFESVGHRLRSCELGELCLKRTAGCLDSDAAIINKATFFGASALSLTGENFRYSFSKLT